MSDARRQLGSQDASNPPSQDGQGDCRKSVYTIKLTPRDSAQRRSEPVPIAVAVAEAYTAIAARGRNAALRLRDQAGEALRRARATG